MARPVPPRVFLDTNVLVSGLHSPTGPPGKILRLYAEGRIRAVISRRVLDELVRTIEAKLPVAMHTVKEFLLSAPPEIVPDPASDEEVRALAGGVNPVDAPVLVAAINSAAGCFVTGDKAFLAQARAATTSLMVLSPHEFIERFAAGALLGE